jgi:hypothetical protein
MNYLYIFIVSIQSNLQFKLFAKSHISPNLLRLRVSAGHSLALPDKVR